MSRWVKTRPARMFDQCPMLPLQHSEFEFVTCANFRFGSLADIREWIRDVRFTPESGHAQSRHRCLLSANSGHWNVSREDFRLTSKRSRHDLTVQTPWKR